jgi:hypothetical protein
MYADELEPGNLEEFLQRLPACAEALKGYRQDGNAQMISVLDEQLARATATA